MSLWSSTSHCFRTDMWVSILMTPAFHDKFTCNWFSEYFGCYWIDFFFHVFDFWLSISDIVKKLLVCASKNLRFNISPALSKKEGASWNKMDEKLLFFLSFLEILMNTCTFVIHYEVLHFCDSLWSAVSILRKQWWKWPNSDIQCQTARNYLRHNYRQTETARNYLRECAHPKPGLGHEGASKIRRQVRISHLFRHMFIIESTISFTQMKKSGGSKGIATTDVDVLSWTGRHNVVAWV